MEKETLTIVSSEEIKFSLTGVKSSSERKLFVGKNVPPQITALYRCSLPPEFTHELSEEYFNIFPSVFGESRMFFFISMK